MRTIEQIESLEELREFDPLRVTRPWLYCLGSLVAAYLVLRFETDGLWSIAIGLALMAPVSYLTGRLGWDHLILAADSLLMALIVLRTGLSPSAMSFLWATHLGSAILLYQGYQRRVVIGAIGLAIGSSHAGAGVIVPMISVDPSNLRFAEFFAMAVGIVVFLSVMPLASALIGHRFDLQTSMVEEGARRLSIQRQFTSMVSHELRGPLTSIKGFAQLLMDGDTSLDADERAEIHGLIEREAENLNTLVDDILIILRFESGNLLVAADSVNVRRAADEIIGALAHMAQGNDVVIDVDPSHTAVGDEARIRQVIRNLVTNAIKYGGTRVEITSELRDDTLYLSVVDDGDGIPPDLKSQLFDEYAQGTNADASTGYGLGLGISRRLAHLMHGDLVYSDAQPSGAQFTLALPAARAIAIERS